MRLLRLWLPNFVCTAVMQPRIYRGGWHCVPRSEVPTCALNICTPLHQPAAPSRKPVAVASRCAHTIRMYAQPPPTLSPAPAAGSTLRQCSGSECHVLALHASTGGLLFHVRQYPHERSIAGTSDAFA
eukprot:XP_001694816.1 predicted protein [Chlamydomonas reinhardtii]